MILDFPANPSVNDTYSFGGKTWIWNGAGWALNVSGAINNIPIGNITASTGNFTTVTANSVTATSNVGGGNINATANVTGTGAVFSGNVSADTFIGNISGNIDAGGANTNIQFNDDDVLAGSAAFTFDKISNLVTATGNISAGNVVTLGQVTATGNVTGGNLLTAGNITGANLDITGQVTATGNVTGGNLVTAGVVLATGNVSGGNISTAGNVDGANINATAGITAATTITATGNVSGGNIVTTGNVDANNVNATTTITAVDVIASGNVDGANVNTDSIVGTAISITATSVDMNLTGNLSMSGRYINQVANPAAAQDAATKQYVDDAVSSGIHIHDPVQLETPTALPAATYAQGGTVYTVTDTIAGNTVVFSTAANLQPNDQLWFANSFEGIVGNTSYFVVSAPNTSAAVLTTVYAGPPVSNITSNTGLTESVRVNSGIGATLTATANGALTVDSVAVSAGNRILVYNQSTQYENGVYSVTDPGNVSAPWILTRATDSDQYRPDSNDGMDSGSYYFVQQGATGAGESYVLTSPQLEYIIGYDAVTFTQFSASQVYSANTQAGINLSGTVFSAKVDDNTTAFDGGGNISVKAGANLVTPNIGDATGNSLTLSGNGLLSATTVEASGNITGGNVNSNAAITAVTIATSGNIDGANLNATSAIVAGTTVTAAGNITGGNITTTGELAAGSAAVTGNITTGNILTDGYYYANGAPFAGGGGGSGTPGGSNTQIQFNDSGAFGGSAAFTFNKVTNAVSITGNVSAGNITTAGTVAATGNVSGGNLIAVANVLAAGAVFTNPVVAPDFVTPVSVISSNTAATSGTLYVFTDTLTLTLPAGPAVGDSVLVSNRSNQTDCIIDRNSSNIMGSSENLQVNVLNAAFELVYVNPSQGWILL